MGVEVVVLNLVGGDGFKQSFGSVRSISKSSGLSHAQLPLSHEVKFTYVFQEA